MVQIKIPPYVNKAVSRLEKGGFRCFIVGGCVRDALSGKTPHDYDLTTNATPDEMLALFSDMKVIETGLKHGTVTVVIDGENLEITTFRTDGVYLDGRHPENVTFSRNIEDDLSRRDFTVNAMAFSESYGLYDLFGGQDDLKNGIIRAVGDPETRFREDALRIMRGLRFAANLGFKIDSATADAMHECRELQKNVAVERLWVEFTKLICGAHASSILREFADVIGVFLPEILESLGFDQRTRYHSLDVYEHTLAVLDGCEHTDLILRLAAYFHDIAKPRCFALDRSGGHFYDHASVGAQMTDEIFRRMHTDTTTRKKVCHLISLHMKQLSPTERSARRLLASEGDECARRFIALGKADRLACAPDNRDTSIYDTLSELINKISSEESCFSLKDLSVHGDDLIKLGFKGKEIGKALHYLLGCVVDGILPNEKNLLLSAAREYRTNDHES